jgi:hypothetical protein
MLVGHQCRDRNKAITKWIHWYNAERPHQALGCRSPRVNSVGYNRNSWLDSGGALQTYAKQDLE